MRQDAVDRVVGGRHAVRGVVGAVFERFAKSVWGEEDGEILLHPDEDQPDGQPPAQLTLNLGPPSASLVVPLPWQVAGLSDRTTAPNRVRRPSSVR